MDLPVERVERRVGAERCKRAEAARAKQLNVDRFIDYWKPIAAALRRHRVMVGGIQLNSHDRDIYSYAAERIIAAHMPLDYVTIQRYSSFEDLVPDAYAAYKTLSTTAGYEHVKVVFDRYRYDNNQTSAGSHEYFTKRACPRERGTSPPADNAPQRCARGTDVSGRARRRASGPP